MSDYLVKALGYNDHVRAYAIRTTEMVNEAVTRHHAWPTAAAALGRAMTAGSMMGSMLKGEEKLTVKVEGGGPMGPIVVDSESDGSTRGYAHNMQVHFDLNDQSKLDVAQAVGTEGFLSVVKDIGMKDNFTGSVPLVSGELGDDFTYYFVTSEQVPSSVGLGVLVNPDNTVQASGGFILQIMPNAPEEVVDEVEQQIQAMPPISKLIERGKTPEEILSIMLKDEHKIIETSPVSFSCKCSRERIEQALISLGSAELIDMKDVDHGAETQCHFCNEIYNFTEEDLAGLAEKAKTIEEAN
ncbi:molecular chaperone Hsp33 [Salsuginibacillus halophilus]|uniref:33 kDa chaperonin n=1 Tax=Salsuginibacillus halophilus TaxID=517424 RepID=A0A2P8H7R6_9BACI|nr:Hsp33 family molecular chaperone HslO [Salsuginibacillus halophilus]PSL42275.1 molecular chaperone Hsp33 [Salsuginibacillus halophilus]